MSIVTRRRAEEIVHNAPFDPKVLAMIPGWEPVAQAVRALSRHAHELEMWSEREAAAQRTRLGQLAASLRTERSAVLETVAAQLRTLGVDPPARTLAALQAGFQEVLDRLEDAERERRLLGDASRRERLEGELRSEGMITVRELPDSDVAAARLVRDGLDRAAALEDGIDRLEQRVEAVDAYSLDERAVRLEREFSAVGVVPRPDAEGARPRLADDVAQTLARVGIALEGPPEG